jgi:uncharacterized RDD family membrane protein YckC
MERKGFGIRLGATVIDIVFLGVINIILGFIFLGGFVANFGMPSRSSATLAAAHAGAFLIYSLLVAAIALAYFTTEIFMAASPGHTLLKLKITREDGSPADQQTLIKRFCIRRAPQILALLTVIPLLGLLIGLVNIVVSIVIVVSCFMTLRVSRLALHDEWSGTAVYGPVSGVVPAGFPVQPTSTTASTTTNVPPPTAPVG